MFSHRLFYTEKILGPLLVNKAWVVGGILEFMKKIIVVIASLRVINV